MKDSKKNFQRGEPIVYSAAIAFFTIFSLPSILIIVSFLGSLFFSEADVQKKLVQHIEALISQEAAHQVSEVLRNLTTIPVSFWGIVVGLAVIIKSATIIFFIIQKALNAVWQVRVKHDVKYLTLLRHRIPTLLVVASLGFLFITSILLDTVISIYSGQLQDLFEEYLSPAIRAINTAFNILMMLVFFTALHKVLPDARVGWKNAVSGGVITSVLFLVGKEVISLILENVKVTGIYATAGSLVVLLLWVFYSAVILMLGAEVTKAYADYHNQTITPSAIAVKYERVNRQEPDEA